MSIRHYGIYNDPTTFNFDQFIVDNWESGVVSVPTILDRIKTLKPTFPAETYISSSDNYVTKNDGSEHPDETALKAICTSLGLNIEQCYLHWSEDTAVDWGTPQSPDIIAYPAGSRIEKYRGAHQSGNQRRDCISFLPAVHPALVERVRQRAEAVYNGKTWSGIFLDNTGAGFFNFGLRIVSGGTVQETGAKLTLPNGYVDPAFLTWYWANQRAFLPLSRAMLNATGRKQTINVASVWNDDYCNYQLTDRIYQELEGNPIRSSVWGMSAMKHRHDLCFAANIVLSMAPPIEAYRGVPQISELEASYNGLAMHLLLSQATSTTCNQDRTNPWRANWDQMEVSPAEAVVKQRLGTPTSDPYIGETGTTPLGTPYTLWVRDYRKGKVEVRMLNPGNGLTTDTITKVCGPQQFIILPDGTSAHVASYEIKNGGAVISWAAV